MRQGSDGQAHFAYFDKRTQASFVWDGVSDRIEVSIGGYGEPVDHTIPVFWPVFTGNFSPLYFLAEFRSICEDHAASLSDYGNPHPHARFVRQLMYDGPAIGESHL